MATCVTVFSISTACQSVTSQLWSVRQTQKFILGSHRV